MFQVWRIMAKKIKVDIAIPAYNESKHLGKNIKLIVDTLRRQKTDFSWRIIIGENGSKDNTYEVAKKLAKKYKEVEARHFDRPSKDNAIIEIWINSDADILVFTDADNSVHPKFIPDLVKAINNGADIAAGYRFHTKENSRGFYRDTISRIYNRIILPIILPVGTRDAQCGFKAVKSKIAKEISPKLRRENGFFDSELLGVAYYKGHKIREVPVSFVETRESVLSVNKNIPNFLKNIIKTRAKIKRGYYD